jgi:hypothetical protein
MSQSLGGLVATTEEQYKKLNLPALPDSIRELLVTFAPWLSLLGGILGLITFIPGVLVLLALAPVAGVGGAGLGFIFTVIHLILSAVGSVISLMAFGGLRKRTLPGWTLLFWASVVSIVAGLLPLSVGSLIGTVFGAAISLYLLFQIKPYYDGTRVIASPAVTPPAAAV